jgi:hypothetical protein
MRKGEIMGKIFGIAVAILVILALALVQGAPSEVAVAQPSPEQDVEIQPNMTEEDKVLVIALSRQITALDKDGDELEFITISKEDNPPQPPEGRYFVGTVYNMAPDGAVFAPPLLLSMAYDEANLPQGMVEEELYFAYCDDKGQWVDLTSEVDTEANRVTAEVNHFTLFAIMARPASFTLSEFSVMPHIVQVGEPVTAGITVTNMGGCEGSYTVVLKVNDVIEDSKEITLAIGESQEVSFEVIRESAGDYSVDVNGHTASFVAKGTNWGLIGGIVGGIVVVGLLVYFLVFRRKRARPAPARPKPARSKPAK